MKWYKSKAIFSMAAVIIFIGLIICGLSFRIQSQMEKAARSNVQEIVQIIESGIAEIRRNDVDMADQFAELCSADAVTYEVLARLKESSPFARLSFVPAGSEEGIRSDGNKFSLAELPFSETALNGKHAVTDVYMSDLGAWTYTIQCPVYHGGKLAGGFYADVIMERYDDILPDTIFQGKGLVYLLDSDTLRFIYEPTSTNVFISSKYNLHGFLNDFGILDEKLEQSISTAISERKSTIARMWIDGDSSYVYFWPVDQGAWYLCGIIPERSIQGESNAVTQTIAVTSIIIFSAAVLIFVLFYWYSRKNQSARQYQIALFNGIAQSIDDVVLLFDCATGRLELTFDNIKRVLGIDSQELSGMLKEKATGDGKQSNSLIRFLRPENIQEGNEISEKIKWKNPETGVKHCLQVKTSYIILKKSKKCILSILDVTKEEQMQDSLRASVLAAQNASRVKSDFLSQMSHEIRTPMNAVLGMAQIAETRPEDQARVLGCLQKIKNSSRHLLGLINDILDISKIESQKMSLSEAWFELDGFLSDLNDIVSVQAGAKKQQFTIRNLAGSMELLTDSVRLNQVLVNLLNNSVKYTPEGGCVTLTVERTLSKVDDYYLMHFIIKDNGIGMSAAFQEKLFTPFEREDDQAVRSQTGTGLGLAIVQSMVSLMGGSIRVESVKGTGTTFYVDINLRYKSTEQWPQPDTQEEAACDLTGITILLAEDNELNREIAMEFLQMVNARVECAVDGVDAFEKFRDSEIGHFDIILMDMQMPRWNGLEATRQIRALNRMDAKTVPILAVTANAYFEDEQKCLEAGMNDHVAKPLDMQTFYQKVKKYLSLETDGEETE